MALNSVMHDHYLSLPMDAQMMPELEGMGLWARIAHETMLSLNPRLMRELAERGELKAYLERQQSTLAEEARKLEAQWKNKNPLTDTAYFARVGWMKQAGLSARETLIEELAKSMMELAAEAEKAAD